MERANEAVKNDDAKVAQKRLLPSPMINSGSFPARNIKMWVCGMLSSIDSEKRKPLYDSILLPHENKYYKVTSRSTPKDFQTVYEVKI